MNCNTFMAGCYGRPDIGISILRLDLLTHRCIGNKHFKLKNNLQQLKVSGARRVLSFGGAWSNHLLAFAQTTHSVGVKSVGVVRGEEGFDNPMLQCMRSHGMHLHFVSRAQYKLRHDATYCATLCRELDCDSWLPEGGSNELAVQGCEAIAGIIDEDRNRYTRVVAAVGTGATLAGIIRGRPAVQTVTGIPVVSDSRVYGNIQRWVNHDQPVEPVQQRLGPLKSVPNWSLFNRVKPSPYAKPSHSLLKFILDFFKATDIVLDPVYTGPALAALLSADFLATTPRNERIVFVHTGGLAGAQGFSAQFEQCADHALVTEYFNAINELIQ